MDAQELRSPTPFAFHRIHGAFSAVEPFRRPFSVVRWAYGKRRALGQIAADEIDLLGGIRSGLYRKITPAFERGFYSGKSDICAGRLAQQELRRLTVPIEGLLPDHPGAFFESVHNVHDGCAA